ncbi:MAG: hypothetical protein QXD41_03220 [Nitrososphaeria archaeon]
MNKIINLEILLENLEKEYERKKKEIIEEAKVEYEKTLEKYRREAENKGEEEVKKIIDEAQNQYIKGIITDKDEILNWLKQLLLKRYIKPLLTGDELKKLGVPVNFIGKVIEELRQKQLSKQINTKLDAINWVKENYCYGNE